MRYLPHTSESRRDMLSQIGVSDIDDLFIGVPKNLLHPKLKNNHGQAEWVVLQDFEKIANKNHTSNDGAFFLGGGVYNHHVPASVNTIISRGEFLTSYTPYQPEISQGTLQYLFEFQTQVAEITGMDIANASLYDGSTAVVEAVFMAGRITKRKKVLVGDLLHPHYIDTLNTYKTLADLTVNTISIPEIIDNLCDDTACVVLGYPDFFGNINDYSLITKACHDKGILVVAVVTEILSLGAISPPSEWGADIVAAEGQSLGNTMNFGGPHLGLLACRKDFIRQIPGRLCGETFDVDGKRSFVLTLSTREQHIRRDKATSNICTNSGLCALAFCVHLSLLGRDGYRDLALLNHKLAVLCAEKIAKIKNVTVLTNYFFNEFTIELPIKASIVVSELQNKGIIAGLDLGRFNNHWQNNLLIAVTELCDENAIDELVNGIQQVLGNNL